MIGQHMDLYSPDCAVLHSMLGRKVFSKYSVQVRIKSDYISKVMWIIITVLLHISLQFLTLECFDVVGW